MHLFLIFTINQPSSNKALQIKHRLWCQTLLRLRNARFDPLTRERRTSAQRWLPRKKSAFPFCVSSENEPSVYDLQSSGGAPPVGGFIYRGCQSRRLYGSYVFGDKNG